MRKPAAHRIDLPNVAEIGPIVGGVLIGMKVPTQYLFYFAAIPLAIGLVNAIILTPLYRAEMVQSSG